jgi:hypothetical protein
MLPAGIAVAGNPVSIEPGLLSTTSSCKARRSVALRCEIRATYVQMWWPPFDRPVYVHRTPVWSGDGYADPDTGELLPTWQEALELSNALDSSRPVHTMRFGDQADMKGIIAPSPDADRAVRYLTKYLTKAISDPLNDPEADPPQGAREAHIDRMAAELQYLPCSPRCANRLRYGIQPDQPGPGPHPWLLLVEST